MKTEIAELKQEQREFLTQARTVFGLIGDKERLQLHDLRTGIAERYGRFAFWAMVVILYFVKHPF